MRLQRYMAKSGVASRRKSEEIIKSGRVKVNGKVLTEMGYTVKEGDIVTVDGNIILPEEDNVYLLLNKPTGYITTLKDNFNRKTVMNLLKEIDKRIYPVGRLDKDTSGLLLFTNDGKLANKLMHPSYEIKKTYIAKIKGIIKEKEIQKLQTGVIIGNKKTYPAEVSLLEIDDKNKTSTVKITIHEGRNRQVRRMLSRVNHPVITLNRISLGEIELGDLELGKWRYLSDSEIKKLKG